MCVCVHVPAHTCMSEHASEKHKLLLDTEFRVTQNCKLPDVGAGTQTRVLYKSSKTTP